jgi:hypothetical protein
LRGDVAHDITWAKWLKDNVGISSSYDKQLRNIANNFGDYKKLYYLGISFTEFSKRKEHIRLMFSELPDIANYWKQNIPPPPPTPHNN